MSEALCVWNPYPENGIYHCILLPNKTSTKQMLGFDLENLNDFARRLETSRWPLHHSVGRPPARFETSDFVEIRQDFFHFTIQVSCEIFPAQQLCNSGWVCCAPELLFEGKTQGVRPNKQYDCFKKNMLKSTVCHLRSRNHLGNINRVSPSHDWKYPGEMISGDWIRKWCMLLIPPKMPKRKSSLILERDFTYFGDCMGVHVLNTNWCCLFKVITILFYEKQVLLKNPENLN